MNGQKGNRNKDNTSSSNTNNDNSYAVNRIKGNQPSVVTCGNL